MGKAGEVCWVFFLYKPYLGGGFNPVRGKLIKMGSFPQLEVNIKNVWKPLKPTPIVIPMWRLCVIYSSFLVDNLPAAPTIVTGRSLKVPVFFKWSLQEELFTTIIPSWWLNHPLQKICSSKWAHLPQVSGWKFQKYLSCHHLDKIHTLWETSTKTHTHNEAPG